MIQIKAVEKERIPELVRYVMDFRKELFPMIDHSQLPPDLARFEAAYIEDRYAAFLIATDLSGAIVGTIGMRPYDHRFKHLNYKGQLTAEVQKLYVEPSLRELGLGTLLFNGLKEEAERKGIETLYLHTHPFLSGAREFWSKQGFQLVCQDETPVYQTIHMDLQLKAAVEAQPYLQSGAALKLT
ncbi:GNAT family N-acetyltransferase [Pontibacter ramchanderi]|uniref:N-acetylglutamate synthase-like GNAT family acetyltransferase n=1 Tax=Pontibacter ramchanderi TaxID=1179743 RepID=A0A2N3U9V8_9BACT|nr:GNAT family N-acetyltransferase [Pontibacter ramchanderi]PKV63516.1 N-acetylglutamate synthase-like GNAT family acetyltransferase [Pontibacter ramchanderi]